MFELYDFVLFAVLIPIIAPLFFQAESAQGSIMLGYLAFGITFVMALFGSIIWGNIGDSKGSGVIFRFSVLLMGVPSILISVLPTYAEVGILSTIALMALRLLQGFSISGEALGAKIYAFERFGVKNAILSSALISASGALGVLLAMYVGGYIIAHPQEPELWRDAFLFGGTVMFVLSVARSRKTLHSKKQDFKAVSFKAVYDALINDRHKSIDAWVASVMLGLFSYFMHGFLINYLMLKGYAIEAAVSYAQIGLTGTVIAALLVATVSTLYSRKLATVTLKDMAFYITIISLPLLIAIERKEAVFLMGAMLGLYAALAAVKVLQSFKDGDRCRGALFVNAFGVSIFGGFTPLVMTLAAGVHIMLPAVLFSGCFCACYFILARRR